MTPKKFEDEYKTFDMIKTLSSQQINDYFSAKDVNLTNGVLHLTYDFSINNITGWITASYDITLHNFTQVDMDYNFCRPAGLNNYPDLKNVIYHIVKHHK